MTCRSPDNCRAMVGKVGSISMAFNKILSFSSGSEWGCELDFDSMGTFIGIGFPLRTRSIIFILNLTT